MSAHDQFAEWKAMQGAYAEIAEANFGDGYPKAIIHGPFQDRDWDALARDPDWDVRRSLDGTIISAAYLRPLFGPLS